MVKDEEIQCTVLWCIGSALPYSLFKGPTPHPHPLLPLEKHFLLFHQNVHDFGMRPPIWFVSLLNIVNCIDVMTSAPLSRASYARFGFPLLTSKKVSSAGMLFFLSREGNGGPFFKVVLECPGGREILSCAFKSK